MKRFLLLLILAGLAHAQTIEYNSAGMNYSEIAGGALSPGQLLKMDANGRFIPATTADTMGVVGVAATGSLQSGSVFRMAIFGYQAVLVDGACTPGQWIIISPTLAGYGHCTSTTPTGQQIGSAATIAGGTGLVSALVNIDSTSSGLAASANNIFTGTNAFSGVSTFTGNAVFNHGSLGFVNVITNCGLVGDGVTNDGAALVACLVANPGKKFFFPKTQAVGSCDYLVNGNILLPNGHGQIWDGEGAGWAGEGVRICKTVEDGNPLVDIVHANCQNCTIKNLHFTGPSIWTSVTPSQNIPPCTPPTGQTYPAGTVCVNAGDGIKVEAGFTTLENVYVENFGRNGIYLTSDFGGFPDNFNLINVTSNNNRGDGLFIKGGDANAGSSMQFHAYNNMMWGLDDQGFLGNSHYSPQMTANHNASAVLGSTFSITAASRVSNVVTLTAAGHNVSLGNVVVVTGVTDSGFNGTFSVSSTTSSTITYAQTAGNASSSGGTVRLTSNNEFYAATGIVGGAYNTGNQPAAWNTFYSPYCEASQNPITGISKLLIIGGTFGCGIDYTNSPFVIGNGVANSGFQNANFLTGTAGFAFITPMDTGGLLMNWAGGKTLDTSIEHRLAGGNTLTTYWDWVHAVGGTQGGTTQTLSLYRGTLGAGHLRFQAGGPGVGGLNQFNDEGTSTRFNNQTGSSGNIEFYSAGGGQLIFDFLSSGSEVHTPSANNVDVISVKRFTDTSPTGNFLNFKNAASSSVYSVDIKGNTVLTNLLISTAAPTISSGFGTSPSIATNNGTAAFIVNVGTGGTANSGVIGLPTAANGWNCFVTDITTQSTTVFLQKQTASSTTSCTVGNFNTAGAAAAFVASDILSVSAFAR